MNHQHSHTVITRALGQIADFMRITYRIEIREEQDERGKNFLVALYTPQDAKFIIGKNGQNLKALEHVLRLVCAKDDSLGGTVTLDINDYRHSRAREAVEHAKQAMHRVRHSQKAEALLPMSAYERRMVHLELASCPDIVTESIGEEPNRRIIIKPFP